MPEVRLVGDNVEPGIFKTADAMRLADQFELDLVEISPNAEPPVCKIMDYKKFVYMQKKRDKELKAAVLKFDLSLFCDDKTNFIVDTTEKVVNSKDLNKLMKEYIRL